jgi:hypothetical protein
VGSGYSMSPLPFSPVQPARRRGSAQGPYVDSRNSTCWVSHHQGSVTAPGQRPIPDGMIKPVVTRRRRSTVQFRLRSQVRPVPDQASGALVGTSGPANDSVQQGCGAAGPASAGQYADGAVTGQRHGIPGRMARILGAGCGSRPAFRGATRPWCHCDRRRQNGRDARGGPAARLRIEVFRPGRLFGE